MPIECMDHYAIRTVKLDESRDFYVEVLGFRDGARPPSLDFPGCWLYIGDAEVAAVHLVGVDEDDPQALIDYLGDIDLDKLDGSGAVDHLAFRARGADELKSHLDSSGYEYRERTVPDINLRQFFFEDPNGVTVELNYYD